MIVVSKILDHTNCCGWLSSRFLAAAGIGLQKLGFYDLEQMYSIRVAMKAHEKCDRSAIWVDKGNLATDHRGPQRHARTWWYASSPSERIHWKHGSKSSCAQSFCWLAWAFHRCPEIPLQRCAKIWSFSVQAHIQSRISKNSSCPLPGGKLRHCHHCWHTTRFSLSIVYVVSLTWFLGIVLRMPGHVQLFQFFFQPHFVRLRLATTHGNPVRKKGRDCLFCSEQPAHDSKACAQKEAWENRRVSGAGTKRFFCCKNTWNSGAVVRVSYETLESKWTPGAFLCDIHNDFSGGW